MSKNNSHQLVGRLLQECSRAVGIVLVAGFVLLSPHVSLAQDATPRSQNNQQDQVLAKPVRTVEVKPLQTKLDSSPNLDEWKDNQFAAALFPRTSTLPSLNLYAAGLKRNKPRPIERLLREIKTTPNIQGSIYQSLTVEDYSPISRGMYYGAPYYMRAQASTNIWMPTVLFLYQYLRE